MRPQMGRFDNGNNNYAFTSMVQSGYGQGFTSFGFSSFGNGFNSQFQGFPGFDNIYAPNMLPTNFSSMTSGGFFPGSNSTMISNSYVSTVNYDMNGQPIRKEYTSQVLNKVGHNGATISESRQQYKDSGKGIKKVAHQRMLNNQGHKIVKTRDYKLNQENEDNYYMGIEESKLSTIYAFRG